MHLSIPLPLMASHTAINRSWFVLMVKRGWGGAPSFKRATANLRSIAGLSAIPTRI